MIPTYEAAGNIITWGALDLSKGWAEDTFLDIQPIGDRVTTTFGADGAAAPSKIAVKGATIEMTFQQNAPINNDLAKILSAQDVIGAPLAVFPFQVRNLAGTQEHFLTLNCYLDMAPSTTMANEAGEKTWHWTCETYIVDYDISILTAAIDTYLKF